MHLLVGTVNLKFGINFSRFKFQLKLIKNQLMLLLLILMVFILPLVVKDKLLRFGKLKKCKNHKFNLNLIVIYKIQHSIQNYNGLQQLVINHLEFGTLDTLHLNLYQRSRVQIWEQVKLNSLLQLGTEMVNTYMLDALMV